MKTSAAAPALTPAAVQAHLELADASLLDNKVIMGLLIGGAQPGTQHAAVS